VAQPPPLGPATPTGKITSAWSQSVYRECQYVVYTGWTDLAKIIHAAEDVGPSGVNFVADKDLWPVAWFVMPGASAAVKPAMDRWAARQKWR